MRASVEQLIKNNESYYSLVVAIAKRARDIAEKAEEEGVILTEKPVKLAEESFLKGQYKFIEKENIGKEIE